MLIRNGAGTSEEDGLFNMQMEAAPLDGMVLLTPWRSKLSEMITLTLPMPYILGKGKTLFSFLFFFGQVEMKTDFDLRYNHYFSLIPHCQDLGEKQNCIFWLPGARLRIRDITDNEYIIDKESKCNKNTYFFYLIHLVDTSCPHIMAVFPQLGLSFLGFVYKSLSLGKVLAGNRFTASQSSKN